MGLLFMPLASCGGDGDDDEPEQGAVSGDKNLLLGGWEISNLEDVTIFMKNNKVMYSGKLYSWNYNPTTMILATDIESKNNNKFTYQWNLTMISEDSWTGFYLTYGGSQLNARASRTVYGAVREILSRGSWMTKNGDELPIDSYSLRNYDLTESPDRNSIEMERSNGRITYTMVDPYDYDNVYIKDSEGNKYYKNVFEK